MNLLSDLHPSVVHFPVALLVTYALLEIIGIFFKKNFISNTALLLLILGAIGAFFAVLTGNEAAESYRYWNNQSSNVLDSHKLFATLTVWFSAAAAAVRFVLYNKKKFDGWLKYIFAVFAIALLFLIYSTAKRGGEMTYKYGIGTEIKIQQND